MTKEDHKEFKTIIHGLVELYGREKMSEIAMELYWSALKDLSIDEIRKNANVHVRVSHFFPKPADLRNDATDNDMAYLAASRAMGCRNSVGVYRSVQFEDLRIHSVIETMGGWVNFCKLDEEDKWIEKRFVDLYKAFQSKIDHIKHLPGIEENSKLGICNIDPPKLVKCKYMDSDKKLLSKINLKS